MSSNNFSYSKIDTYNSCPFKYKLQYEDGNYAFSGSIATEFGTAVHKAEEEIARAIVSKSNIDYIGLKNNFIRSMLEIEKKYPDDYYKLDSKSNRNYRDKSFEYLKNGIYRLEKLMVDNPSYKIIDVEKRFNFDYDATHKFNGAIDRIIFDENTGDYIIQDIKTYSAEIKDGDLKTPLQFVIYVLAIKSIFNCDENHIKCQYDLPLVGITQDCGSAGFINRGITKIEKLFLGINSANWEPKQSPLCNYCSFCRTNPDAQSPYKFLCPYYCTWERTTRNRFDLGNNENDWQGLDNHQLILEAFHKKYNIVC